MGSPIAALRIVGAVLLTVAAIAALTQAQPAVAALFAVAALLGGISAALQQRRR